MEDLDDTISRLQSFRRGGADVVYAPGLVDLKAITRIVEEVKAPVNMLLRPNGPSVAQLARVGVRRLSTGGGLPFRAAGGPRPRAGGARTAGSATYAQADVSGAGPRVGFAR